MINWVTTGPRPRGFTWYNWFLVPAQLVRVVQLNSYRQILEMRSFIQGAYHKL